MFTALQTICLLLTMCLAVFFLYACGAPDTPPPSNDSAIAERAHNAGAVPLMSLLEGPVQPGAQIVIDDLRAEGDDPTEFFVSLDPEGTRVVFHLWHESAFLPENEGVLGNPGGRCRDIHVDHISGEIVARLWWQ